MLSNVCVVFFNKSRLFISSVILVFALILGMQPALANNKYAAFVYDANKGKVLFARNADSTRYPASLTKMMTLYMVFDAIDAGKINLSTRMKVSRYASQRPPSKLYLKAGSTIRVKDAILALVTKSANDVATVIGEHLGGTESNFARQMTRKARSLGMKSTTFANASGLPNSRQKTTARDMARLGLALRKNHPRSFAYFKTRSFRYGKTVYRNHNRLLGRVGGVNGIKTGYIRASGFNLVTNVEKDGRHLVAVVMGGKSGRSRDAHMANLIHRHIKKASRKVRKKKQDPLLVSSNKRSSAIIDPPLPIAKPSTPILVAQKIPLPEQKLPQPVSSTNVIASQTIIAANAVGQSSTSQEAAGPQVISADITRSIKKEETKTITETEREGWKIQISATPDLKAAEELLKEATQKGAPVLSKKTPYTETVQKGSSTLYRVRFAGFETQYKARQACRFMKRKKYKCIYLN